MTRIGITGGIGSGKTYVCQLLQQRGIPVYQCDDEAKRLMTEQPDLKIQDVAARCGFSSPEVFSRSFTRETGTPPSKWGK